MFFLSRDQLIFQGKFVLGNFPEVFFRVTQVLFFSEQLQMVVLTFGNL